MDMDVEMVDRLYNGSIDMHVHCAPDPEWHRRCDAFEVADEAERGGMRAVVLKSFFYNPVVDAYLADQRHENVSIFGSVTIGYSTTGGLEYAAYTVEEHAKMGAKVVWFPAFDSQYGGFNKKYPGLYILNEDKTLKQEAIDVLEVVKKYDMVLCKGHMSYEETKALFKKAVEMGIDKIVLTHPLADSWGRFTDEQILELVDMGSYCEFVGGNMFPRLGSMDPADYVDMIHKVGAQRCILSSDAGQCMDPTPAESFRYFIAMMVQFGCTEEEVRIMCQDNPARLLGLQ